MAEVVKSAIWLVFAFVFLSIDCSSQSVIPGHAHNDYLNKHALFEALDARLVSVEADVHLMKGDLYVAHVRPLWTSKKRSLENLYLKPLFEHIKKNNGKVYPDYEGPFYLMIDFKGGSVEMYDSLIILLSKYKQMLTIMEDSVLKPGAVTVFLSGSKPTEAVLKSEPKLAFLDGRPSDLGKQIDSRIMPVISDHYKNHLSWNGKGKMSEGKGQITTTGTDNNQNPVTAYFEQYSNVMYTSYDVACETALTTVEPCLDKGDMLFVIDTTNLAYSQNFTLMA